jgi:hypothetical protein
LDIILASARALKDRLPEVLSFTDEVHVVGCHVAGHLRHALGSERHWA